MRVTGGKYRGRRIDPLPGFRARPTTDFAREGLFNILDNRIDFEETRILDLFAGSGSISYEFSSRGAMEIHLVEQDSKYIAGIRRTIKDIGFENIKAIHIDARTYLKICKEKYDIVFADPPYDLPWLGEIPDMIARSGILEKDGFFILEHSKRMNFSGHKLFFEHRVYGGVNFSFFKAGPI